MLLIGLLLLAVTGAFTGLVIADNLPGGPEDTVSVLGNEITTMNTLAIFCSGLALALIFCLGLAMTMRGSAHRRHRNPRARRTRATGPDTMTEPHPQH